MAARQQVRLGLIGLGEVGSALAKGLHEEGLSAIAAYDPGAAEGPFRDLLQTRAREAGVALVPSLGMLAAQSEVVLCVAPGSRSVAVAEALAPHLGPQHLFADLASATPKVKRAAAALAAPSGARLADGSLMGAPLIDGHRVEIIASGPAASELRDMLTPWGMNIATAGAELGDASGIKIFRSVIAKGLEALLVECLLATEQMGISQAVLDSYSRFLDQRPFAETAGFLVATDVIHAQRRAEEAAMSAEALRDAGVTPLMTEATVARLRSVADLKLKDELGGHVPADYAQAMAAIARHLLPPAPAGERP